MARGKFEFRGTGLGYLWLFIWTTILTLITLGIFVPWAAAAVLRWKCANTYIDGRQLCFKGSGGGFFANWLLILIFSIVTLGIYAPWGAVRLYRWVAGNTYFADPGDVEYLVEAKGAEKVKKVGYCANCGSKIPTDTLFCDQCGSRVQR